MAACSLSPSDQQGSCSDEDDGSGNRCTIGSEIYLDVSYLHYLCDARLSISGCIRACRVWSAPYDGEIPPPERYQAGVLEEPAPDGRQPQRRVPPPPVPPPPLLLLPPPPRPRPTKDLASFAQLELEWDDSFDACPVQEAEASANPKPSSEPLPKHIQEMRRSAIMLVKGSYSEESDFQDDVMVYDLVAKKDASEMEWAPPVDEAPLASPKNGLSRTLTADNAKNSLKAKVKGDTDCNGNLQKATNTSEDLLAQYEELIRSLVSEAGGKPVRADGEVRKAAATEEEEVEEEEMDFTSFTAETPESEKPQSPVGAIQRFRSGSCRGNLALPFTGQFRLSLKKCKILPRNFGLISSENVLVHLKLDKTNL